MVRIGRTSTPGWCMSRISQVMPLCFGRVGIGADEQLAPVGHVGPGAPDLLAVHDVLVALAHRPGAQRREVGAGLRARRTPGTRRVSPRRMRGRWKRPLLVGALGDERGPACIMPDEVHADVRRVGPGVLLEVHELLGDRQAPAAVLLRPVDPGVPGVVELALPLGVVGAAGRPVAGRGRRAVGRHLRLEPGPQLGRGRPRPRRCRSGPSALHARTARARPPRSTLPAGVRGSASTTRSSSGSS